VRRDFLRVLLLARAQVETEWERAGVRSQESEVRVKRDPPSIDEDGVGGDDAADCLRYLVVTKERKVTQRKLRGL